MKKIIASLLFVLMTACTAHHTVTTPATTTAALSDQQQILNLLQSDVLKNQHTKVTLTAHYFKKSHNWAYIETVGGGDPSINAVLVRVNKNWTLAKPVHACKPVCPKGMKTCAEGELICKNSLHQQFPNAPAAIFPSSSSHTRAYNSK